MVKKSFDVELSTYQFPISMGGNGIELIILLLLGYPWF